MKAFTESFTKLFERDLNSLIKQLRLYENESRMWLIDGEIKNSGGNLSLHIIGNLRHFIGHVLGGKNYIRKREEEFNKKDVLREELISEIELVIMEVNDVLSKIDNAQLLEVFPINVLGYEMTTAYFISHLYGHLSYHLGQVNYHRRLINI